MALGVERVAAELDKAVGRRRPRVCARLDERARIARLELDDEHLAGLTSITSTSTSSAAPQLLRSSSSASRLATIVLALVRDREQLDDDDPLVGRPSSA